MTSRDLSNSSESALLGVEIGRNKIRLALLDGDGKRLIDVVERPIAKAGGPRDPIEQELSTRAALEAALDRLGFVDGVHVLAGATIGFANCGVGSGPALQGWLETLSDEIEEPIVLAGDDGISYSPSRCVEFVQRVFEQAGLQLDRVELAPVAATRVLRPLRSGALTLGSGVAWSARVLNDQVLEAFEATDGPFDDVLHVVAGGVAEPLMDLDGVEVDEELCRNRGVPVAALAPAAGVAVSLLGSERTNLLDGETVYGSVVAAGTRHGGRSSAAAVPPTGGWVRSDTNDDVAVIAAETEAGSFDDFVAEHEGWPSGRIGDTHQLRTLPGSVEHSREYAPPPERDVSRPRGPVAAGDDLEGIEAFAHPVDDSVGGFDVSDFLLGALSVLAIVLALTLVLL